MRIEYPGAAYHIYARGNRRRDIFLDREDRVRFVRYLEECCQRQELLLHAYCLMTNHYHLLLETVRPNLARSMHLLNGRYARCFNHRHELTGHVFQGRYGAILVQKQGYLLDLARYIALNPVRAGVVDRPEDYDWSSFRTEIGLPRRQPTAGVSGFLLEQFADAGENPENRYLEYVMDGVSSPSPLRAVAGGIALGSRAFVDSIVERISSRPIAPGISADQTRICRRPLDDVFSGDARTLRPKRDAAILEAVRECGYRQKEVAAYLGLHPVTVCRIVGRMSSTESEADGKGRNVKI